MRSSFFAAVAGFGLLWASASGYSDAATIDATTSGNWVGTYGSQGYILLAYATGSSGASAATASPTNDLSLLPSYISSYSYSAGWQQYVWQSGTSDSRALQNPNNPAASGNRSASTSYISNDGQTREIDLTVSTPTQFQLAIYGLDWDNYNGRDATITVNGASVELDNTSPSGAYHSGEWAIFNIDAPAGPLAIDLKGIAGANSNSVLSGIMFDAVPEPSMLTLAGAAGAAMICWRRRR